mmetsp:Transcript_6038/g.12289  ORF Transcript_6038/g.12289 Transcript_6038/m.12289 type:complete len:674 (-) Transcript_6038:589-2610(-)
MSLQRESNLSFLNGLVNMSGSGTTSEQEVLQRQLLFQNGISQQQEQQLQQQQLQASLADALFGNGSFSLQHLQHLQQQQLHQQPQGFPLAGLLKPETIQSLAEQPHIGQAASAILKQEPSFTMQPSLSSNFGQQSNLNSNPEEESVFAAFERMQQQQLEGINATKALLETLKAKQAAEEQSSTTIAIPTTASASDNAPKVEETMEIVKNEEPIPSSSNGPTPTLEPVPALAIASTTATAIPVMPAPDSAPESAPAPAPAPTSMNDKTASIESAQPRATGSENKSQNEGVKAEKEDKTQVRNDDAKANDDEDDSGDQDAGSANGTGSEDRQYDDDEDNFEEMTDEEKVVARMRAKKREATRRLRAKWKQPKRMSEFSRSRPKRGQSQTLEAESEPPMAKLARLILEGKHVVFITGAGLSVASGIPPFRGQDDAVWEESVYTWGTREKFEENPLAWYNTFWLRHFDEGKAVNYFPNPGHAALARICANYPESAHLITQNIDRLHRHTVGKIDDDQLIEIHGYSGGYKCYTDDCIYQKEQVHYAKLGDRIHRPEGARPEIRATEDLPKCPECSQILAPNCLLFDEDYTDHDSYQFKKAKKWFRQADAFVFVGTSFAVQITNLAFIAAATKPAPIFNFNMIDNVPDHFRVRVHSNFIGGPSEKSLPELADLVCSSSP